MLRIGIVGSRNFQDQLLVVLAVRYLPLKYRTMDFMVVSGKAKGPDSWAAETCKQYFGPQHLEEFEAQWKATNRFGKMVYDSGAGFKRNLKMIPTCQEVLCFWDGSSKGTKHDIEICEKLQIPYWIIKNEQDLYDWQSSPIY